MHQIERVIELVLCVPDHHLRPVDHPGIHVDEDLT